MVLDDWCFHPKGKSILLIDQLDAWLGEISPGVHVSPKKIPELSSVILSYCYENGKDAPKFRPVNVGFGVSYILPMLLLILTATPDDMLVIENPEAHLHPRGQAEIGKLLARAASAGIQLFVETHSDHIISGIQLACKAFSLTGLGLSAESVKLNHFYAKYKHASVVQEIRLQENGRLEYQPKGFFDQSELDMRVLFGNGE
jgi:predicted ATPase